MDLGTPNHEGAVGVRTIDWLSRIAYQRRWIIIILPHESHQVGSLTPSAVRLLQHYSQAEDVMNANLLEVRPTNDEQLETLLQRRLGSRIRELRVHIHSGGLVLQGRAPTYHAKQLAQHAAMELSTAPILANDIEVR